MVSVRVSDPRGPRWMRAVAPALGTSLVVAGAIGPGGTRLRAAALLLGVAVLLLQRILVPRLAARRGSVRFGADSIEVHAGLASQRIRAAEVVAASTARTPGGVALAIVRGEPRSRPVLLEVSGDDDLERLRKSLKLGHYGFGEIAWPTTRSRGGPVRATATALIAAGWCLMALAAACGNAGVCLALALGVVPLSMLLMVDFLLAGAVTGYVWLSSHALGMVDPNGPVSVAYRDIVRVEAADRLDRLTVWTANRSLAISTRAMTPEERDHLQAQIECAADRAHGKGTPPPDVPAPIAILAPQGEERRAWLERVDSAAAALVDGGGAYRRAEMSTEDLWSALESPDAPVPLRIAAARVLARVVPLEASARIGLVLASERDVGTRARIRIALEEDLDVAARELDRLDRRRRA